MKGWAFFRRFIFNFDDCCRRTVWESNLKIVEEHNLQADEGVHTYWLGMNEFADLVNVNFCDFVNNYLFFIFRIDCRRIRTSSQWLQEFIT